MVSKPVIFSYIASFILIWGCKSKTEQLENSENTKTESPQKPPVKVPEGMVWIPGGDFMQGAVPNDKMAMGHEKPAHKVHVDGFFITFFW